MNFEQESPNKLTAASSEAASAASVARGEAASAENAPAESASAESTPAAQRALREEQAFVDQAYGALDAEHDYYAEQLAQVRAQGATGTPAARSERDSFASHYEDNLLRLRNVENRLVLGRLDFTPESGTEPRHIGRITLRDAQRNILLTDWRAPQSVPFYQATGAHSGDVARRRHIQTRFRTVTAVEDELLAAGSDSDTDGLNLTGEGALIAAMGKARDGKMGDIVATIQSEQDAVIRAESGGVLVIQGGPGTGKTAVALHRAAYLLYAERERLQASGVLFIGPSRRFLRYIDQVLPSLGESNVVATTIGELFPGVTPTVTDTEQAAHIKSQLIWRKIAKRAVPRILEKPLASTERITINGKRIELTPADIAAAQRRARQSGKPHNLARNTYARYLVELLAERLAAASQVRFADAPWLVSDVASDPDVKRLINLHWLPASPQWLLEHLFAWPEVLAKVAPELSAAQRAALRRAKGSGFSIADIPLLDELAEHLGEFASAADRAAANARKQADQQLGEYVEATMKSMGLGGGIVNSRALAERVADSQERADMAEQAAADRTWTYGHVIVDEAQELTPMQWVMVARRNPARSMTIVGDLDQRVYGDTAGGGAKAAQGGGGAGARGNARKGARGVTAENALTAAWQQAIGDLGSYAKVAELTISYRTPSSILDRAARVMAQLGHPVRAVQGVRDIPGAYQAKQVPSADFAAALAQALRAEWQFLDAEYGAGLGSIAVIVPDADAQQKVTAIAAATAQAERWESGALAEAGETSAARINVLTARMAKGLEYDSVIIVEPDQIAQGSFGDLYVALTRATKHVRVISTRALLGQLDEA